MQALKCLSERIQSLFANSPKFYSPQCQVTSLDEMSLWSARKFLDFSRYDYLSFGKEEDTPEN